MGVFEPESIELMFVCPSSSRLPRNVVKVNLCLLKKNTIYITTILLILIVYF